MLLNFQMPLKNGILILDEVDAYFAEKRKYFIKGVHL